MNRLSIAVSHDMWENISGHNSVKSFFEFSHNWNLIAIALINDLGLNWVYWLDNNNSIEFNRNSISSINITQTQKIAINKLYIAGET